MSESKLLPLSTRVLNFFTFTVRAFAQTSHFVVCDVCGVWWGDGCVSMWRHGRGKEGGTVKNISKNEPEFFENSFLNEKWDLVNREFVAKNA